MGKSRMYVLAALVVLAAGGLFWALAGQQLDARTLAALPLLAFGGWLICKRRLNHRATESDNRFRSAFEDAAIGMALQDHEGRYLRVNQALLDVLGYSEAEVLGRSYRDFTHPGDLSMDREYDRQLCTGAIDHHCGEEKRYRHRDGHWVHALVSASLVRDAAGRPSYRIVQVLDVSERNTLQAEILAIGQAQQERIGSELHDGLGQRLTGIALQAKVLAQKLNGEGGRDAETYADAAQRIAAQASAAVAETRAMAEGLFPSRIETMGLDGALEKLVDDVNHAGSVHCVYIKDESLPDLEPERATHLYRIVQEAIHNAIRHGEPRHIVVHQTTEAGRLVFSIEDDGRGINGAGSDPPGLGLRLMRHRAQLIGGTVHVGTNSQGGVSVVGRVPLA